MATSLSSMRVAFAAATIVYVGLANPSPMKHENPSLLQVKTVQLPQFQTATAALLQAAASTAGPGMSPTEQMLKTLDRNGDGKITPDEVASMASLQGLDAMKASSELQGLDANGDGALDMAELSASLDHAAASSPQVATVIGPTGESRPTAVLAAESSVLHDPAAAAGAAAPAAQLNAQPNALKVQPVPDTAPAAGGAAAPDANAAAAPESPADFETSASQTAELLVKSRNAEEGAAALDRVASELHANSTLVARKAMSSANEAASKAARSKSMELVQMIENLENQAQKAEVQAATLRAKAKSELQSATLATLTAQGAIGEPGGFEADM